MIAIISIALAVLVLGIHRKDVFQKRRMIGLLVVSLFIFGLVQLTMHSKVALNDTPYLIKIFVQWWLTSDQILFRRFLSHQSMLSALLIGIAVNIWGPVVLYLPIKFLIPKEAIEKFKRFLWSKFPRLKQHLEKVNEAVNGSNNDFILFKSPEERKKAIAELVDSYKYDYLGLLVLAIPPIPFVAALLTGGAVFASESLKIKYGLLVIIMGKIIKVFGLATIAYFAYFI